ncbi:hypothetical protein Asppvi_003417 [Aspergillus pseudoviridinutans]|uniref:Uncharacterized protein n=1 Tax=Aspergillus pseudoviridinutans TaxID=1517512 RepID=A0A9P3B8B7_9EURO|nr:uncharacterized protein Asppvi_003417 [Aspergillus pseudoviridinutans]GIJ84570.1 hypothetical protein Asppvi_003417 [Aspergillus pseudoviridinutans]
MTPAPSDHGSFASIDEATLQRRKRPFSEAMGGNEGSTHPGAAPQDPPSRGLYYQGGSCPPCVPPMHTSALNLFGSLLPPMAQRPDSPEPPQGHANPVTVSHATLDMLNMAATRPPLGFEHHKYPGTQQFVPSRITSDGTMSMHLAHVASTFGGYDGPQLLQGFAPQSMPPYSPMQWTQGRPIPGHGGEYMVGTQFQESPAPVRNNVEGETSGFQRARRGKLAQLYERFLTPKKGPLMGLGYSMIAYRGKKQACWLNSGLA